MKRSGISLDQAVDKVYLSYESVLNKKGIDSKEKLKQKMLEHYSSGDLEKHVLKISLDKFITLMLRMIIDAPNLSEKKVHDSKTSEPKQVTDNEKNALRTSVIKFVRKHLNELKPLPTHSTQPQKELAGWEEDNAEDIREMYDNIIDNFGERALYLGLDIDHVITEAYHIVIEDEFK